MCTPTSVLYTYYRQREEWLKGKTKMWDVFLDDMGLNNSVELALANLDLNELVLESVTFDDGDPLEGSSSTSTNARIALDIGGGGGGWTHDWLDGLKSTTTKIG
jgi:hypothetical protein